MADNYVDSTGLVVQTLTQITDQLTAQFQAIYGVDINVDPNSPDGQMLNIFAQAKIDLIDCISMVYNSFNPTVATGVVLDQRCAINGVVRKGPSYTRTQVDITADQVVTLNGLDTVPNSPFAVSDSTGNIFFLEETTTLVIGVNTLEFISAVAGAVLVTNNTLTTIVTITLGVVSSNNPSAPISVGVDEENDTQLRLRRQASVSLPSLGYLPGLIAALTAVENVVDAVVYENDTDVTDVDLIPSHSIWCIVDGGTDDAVADAIYRKRNAGCGMKGVEFVLVPQVNGYDMLIKFDRPIYEDLYIEMVLESIDPAHVIDTNAIKNLLFNDIVYNIYQPGDFTAMVSLVKLYDPLAVLLSGGVNDTNSGYLPFKYPSTKQSRWLLDQTRMDISQV
jgi:uncharacterized phage protein gp47/JayE